ncbi:unnamed protein product, partial [Polarella glacialis]
LAFSKGVQWDLAFQQAFIVMASTDTTPWTAYQAVAVVQVPVLTWSPSIMTGTQVSGSTSVQALQQQV